MIDAITNLIKRGWKTTALVFLCVACLSAPCQAQNLIEDAARLLAHADLELDHEESFMQGVADLYLVLQEGSYRAQTGLMNKLCNLIKKGYKKIASRPVDDSQSLYCAHLVRSAVAVWQHTKEGFELYTLYQQHHGSFNQQEQVYASEHTSKALRARARQAEHDTAEAGNKHEPLTSALVGLPIVAHQPRKRAQKTAPRKRAVKKVAARRKKKEPVQEITAPVQQSNISIPISDDPAPPRKRMRRSKKQPVGEEVVPAVPAEGVSVIEESIATRPKHARKRKSADPTANSVATVVVNFSTFKMAF